MRGVAAAAAAAWLALPAAAAAAAAAAAPTCASKSCASPGGCPTDNPVAAFFGPDAYAWTDAVAWGQCVYSIADYPGPDFQAQVDAAAAAAHACAGATAPCVVYVPPGTYGVPKGLALPSFTVLRGEAPSSAAAKAGKLPGDLNPSSVLLAPELTLPTVGCDAGAGGECASVGLVHLALDGAAVRLVGGPTSGFALAFGLRSQNVNFRYPGGPGSTWPFPWPYRFTTAVLVQQSPNTLIGNNLLPRSPLALNTTVSFAPRGSAAGFNGTVPFAVDCRYGISAAQPPGVPTVNVSVDANYVFQNGRIGVSWASFPADLGAPPGSGARVANNHVEVAANTVCYSVDGTHVATGQDTNENRGYDQTGTGGSWVVNNTGHIHRQSLPTTARYLTVDGEGVLQQTQDGLSAVGNLWEGNDLTGGSSGFMLLWDLKNITRNVITGNSVLANMSVGVWDCRGCVVTDNVCSGNSVPCTGM